MEDRLEISLEARTLVRKYQKWDNKYLIKDSGSYNGNIREKTDKWAPLVVKPVFWWLIGYEERKRCAKFLFFATRVVAIRTLIEKISAVVAMAAKEAIGVGRKGRAWLCNLLLSILKLRCLWVIQEEPFRRYLIIEVWSLRESYRSDHGILYWLLGQHWVPVLLLVMKQ